MESPPIFLIGFMATGKTTVGRLVAARLGRRFVDLDDVIAAYAGWPVPSLVATDEAAFRRQEADALAKVIDSADDGPVIATGGGCAAYGDNLARMRSAGLVVALTAALPEIRRRAASDEQLDAVGPMDSSAMLRIAARGPQRPLLARDDAYVAALAAARERFYRGAHVGLATDELAAEQVADIVVGIAARAAGLGRADRAGTSWVGLGRRSYPIVARDAGFDGALVRAAVPDATGLAIITDDNVARAWLDALVTALGTPAPAVVRIAPGEASKSFATYSRVCDALVAAGLDRGSAIVALGGGVVGDLAGLCAATLFRGIPWVQVPTSIVAMTDAAIGGKTGIDLAAGKNLVGAFWQPALVAAHLPVLATLPARERRAGFGELWKYALLDGPALWSAVDALAPWATAADGTAPPPGALGVIRLAAAHKAWIVGQDELERSGTRMLLNLGHTVGHALESEHGLLHGEAVALGLVAACRVSAALGLGPADLADAVAAAVARTGLPADPGPLLTDAAIARVGVDKKRRGTNVRFVAIREVGRCEVITVAAGELSTILRSLKTL